MSLVSHVLLFHVSHLHEVPHLSLVLCAALSKLCEPDLLAVPGEMILSYVTVHSTKSTDRL